MYFIIRSASGMRYVFFMPSSNQPIGSAFMALRWFGLAHVHNQIFTLHKSESAEPISKFLLNATPPIVRKCWTAKARGEHAKNLTTSLFNHLFIFLPTFPLGSVTGQQPWKDSQYLTVNSNFRWFCRLHTKTWPSKFGGVVAQQICWTTSGLSSCGQGLREKFYQGVRKPIPGP